MSTDRAKAKQVDQVGTLTETKSAAEITSAAETEISDETLEAVAGGESLDSYNVKPLDQLNVMPTGLARTS